MDVDNYSLKVYSVSELNMRVSVEREDINSAWPIHKRKYTDNGEMHHP